MGANQIIYIRTDGNSQIATGHLVRCLSIAAACVSLQQRVCFLISDKESAGLLQGFLEGEGLSSSPLLSVKILQTASYDNLEQELPELLSFFSSFASGKPPVYLLDSYFVTEKYLTALQPVVALSYLDDLQLFDYPVELLINYDVISPATLPLYQAAYQKAKKTLLGPSYTPLRSQFQNRKITVKKQLRNLLLTTGGSDPFHFCLRFLELWQQMYVSQPVTLHVVVGKCNPDKERLSLLSQKLPLLQLHENVSQMASLMEGCDLAVSAAGTTLYELCAMGIPTISFTMADNQLTAANAFSETGAIPYAGDLRNEMDEVFSGCAQFMTRMSSFEERKAAHQTMHKLVDGKGALRIANALIS